MMLDLQRDSGLEALVQCTGNIPSADAVTDGGILHTFTSSFQLRAGIGLHAQRIDDLLCGERVLTVAVLAILITAPLGAFAIDCTFPRLLQSPEEN